MTVRETLPSRREIGLVVFLVVCGIVLRVIFPGADAIHPRWPGWVTDEGRWTELAREWALFRSPDLDSPISRIHLLMAPLFQGVVALTFEAMGVGLEAARLPSRVAGIALLLLAVVGLKRALPFWAWVVLTALVAIHPELVYFSRVAIPEMTALLAGFAAFLLVVRPDASRRTDALAGLLTFVAVAFKATTLLYVPAFALSFLVMGRPLSGRSPLERMRSWGLGLLLPAVVMGGGVVAATGFRSPQLTGSLGTILGFVEFTGLYDMGTTFLLGESTDDVNLLLAVLCPLLVAVALRNPPDSAARRVHRGAMAWAAMWIVPLMVLDYFPPRYVVHLHLALILSVAGAIALVSDPRGRPLAEGWASWSRGRRIAAGAVAGLPLAVIAVPATLVLVDAVGPRLDQMRVIIPSIAAAALGLGAVAARRPVAWVFGPVVFALPLGAALIWRSLQGPAADRYWVLDASVTLLPWAVAVAGGGLLAWALGRSLRTATPELWLASGSVAYVAALAVLWGGIRHAPTLSRPSYALNDISEALTERYPPDAVIGVAKLTGAFINTPFRYRELFTTNSLPDAVVTTIWSPELPTEKILGVGFQPVMEFAIPVFLFRGEPRPRNQPLFYDRMPVDLLERRAGGAPER